MKPNTTVDIEKISKMLNSLGYFLISGIINEDDKMDFLVEPLNHFGESSIMTYDQILQAFTDNEIAATNSEIEW